jgi:hypothetical protein
MKSGRAVLLNDESLASGLLDFPGGLRSLIELALPFVFFKTHETYNSGMGRMRIKKKEVVLPFRETVAYRMLLLAGSIIVFVVALFVMVGAFQANTITFVASATIGVAAAFAVFYNLNHLRDAKIPKQTLQKMKRR